MPITRGQLVLVHTRFGWKQAKCCEIFTNQIRAQLIGADSANSKSYTFNRCNVREVTSPESSDSCTSSSTNIVVNQTVNFRQTPSRRQKLPVCVKSNNNCIDNIRTVAPSRLPVFLIASAGILVFRAVGWVCESSVVAFGKVVEWCYES